MKVLPQSKVLIVHSAGWAGIARLPILLRAAGARVTVMSPKNSYLLATEHAHEKIVVPDDMQGVIAMLQVHLLERQYALVILSDDDLLAALVERSGDEAWIRDILPVSTSTARAMITSKRAFLDGCREFGILVVEPGTVANGLICASETLFDRGIPVCWSPFEKFRVYPPGSNHSAVRVMFSNPQLDEIVAKIGAMTHMHGFASFSFTFDRALGDIRVLDMYFRPGPGMHFRGRTRALFANGLAAVLRGQTYHGPRTPGEEGTVVSMFPQDVRRMLATRDVGHIARAALRRSLLSDFPTDDVTLLRFYAREAVEHIVPARIMRIMRVGKRIVRSLRRTQRLS